MSKPVEIEFLMKDKLSNGIDNANAHIDTLIANARKAAELVNAKIAEQHKVIDGVAADLSRMERQLAGMKPGTAQKELAADVMACRKVLDEERNTLVYLEKQHRQAEKAVQDLEKEHSKLSSSSTTAAAAQKTLAERIAESKDLVKYTTANIKELEKAYKNAAPGNAQGAALAELTAAKKALEEEKAILASLTREQEENRESNKRLAVQLRELQDAMAKMRLEGRQNTDEYREMADKAAELSDTISDLRQQTKTLSDDDADLQGLMSGVSGLSGMFTAATGAVSLFAGENENLAKIQARVQSVMAITMGLQQAFNTLNKDSAFRLVTVVKMKNMLTAANTRLSAALGISTAAASALMATLTLGLSAAVTGLIVLFNKYSDAQEEARRKAQELVEVESEGRAQMIKTRFEIDNTLRELKEFTGSKEEEKKKTEELNRKYGEAFGYYDTVAEWYDVLTRKAQDYIQMLFLQAKAQALVNKAVEADEKVNELKSTDADDVDGSVGWFKKMLLYSAQSHSNGQIDAQAIIKEENEKNKEKAIAEAEKLRDALLEQAEDLTKEMGEIGKNSNIGGHSKPEHKQTGGDNETKKRLEAQEELNNRLKQLQQKNTDDTIALMRDGTEKKLAEIRNDYNKRKAEIDKQEAELKKNNKEAGKGGSLTTEQSDALARARELADRDYAQQTEEAEKEALKAQAEAMRGYLREYGTYQQQKLAIAEEYAQKIREANESADSAETKAWKVKSLEAERDKAVQQTEIAAIRQRIDWGSVFGEFGAMFKEQLQPTIDSLKSIAQSKEFKSSSLEEQKTLYELINKLEQSNTVWDGDIFAKVSQDIMAYQSAMNSLVAAQERERKATEALTSAKERLKKAEADGDEVGADIAKAEVSRAQDELAQASGSVKLFGTQVEKASSDLQSSSQQAVNQLQQLESGLSGLTSGSLKGVGNALLSLDKLFGGDMEKKLANTLAQGFQSLLGEDSKAAKALTEALGSSGMAGQIISAVLGILDLIAQNGISGIVSSLQDTIFGAAEKMLDDVLSGDIIVKPLENLGSHLSNIADTLTFGGFSSWTNGDSDKTLHEDLERLSHTNEELQKVMEGLKEAMEDASVASSKQVYEVQKQNIETRMKNKQEQMYRSADASSKGFLGIGSEHSSMYKVNEGMNAERWARVSKAAGVAISSAQDFFNLTSEQMYKVQQYATEDYILIKDLADDGKENAGQFMDDYIEYWKELKEAEEAYYEHLTSISFDTVESDFLSSLMDMDSDAQDFADNFEEYLKKAIMQAMIVDQYKPQMEAWYKKLAKALEDGTMSDAEYEELQRDYENNLIKPATATREALQKLFGWDTSGTSQSAKSGGFTAMTQDQGTKLEGMFTSGLQHWSSMDEQLETVADRMNLAESHLARIAENTGTSAGHLGEIKEDIRKIVRDGLKVK